MITLSVYLRSSQITPRRACAGAIPLSHLTGVAADGRGSGFVVTIAAGQSSALFVRVPPGARLNCQWGTAQKDVIFTLDTMPSDGGIPPTAEATTVADLTTAATGEFDVRPVQTNRDVQSTQGSQDSACAVSAWCRVLTERTSRLYTTWTAALSGATLVRLQWSNTFSWLTDKTVCCRVDVLLADDLDGHHVVIPDHKRDLADVQADARAAYRTAIGARMALAAAQATVAHAVP